MLVPREEFGLTKSFLSNFEGKQPNFGPLGHIVYARTYALPLENGVTEAFWQTCKRVIEGMYQIQKGFCLAEGLPWNDRKAQFSAQEAYQRMWDFKWLPAGRGLSKMGTEHMFKIGGACLNSCGFVSTKDIGNKDIPNAFAAPFAWLMDMSMLGVGVGFDTRGALKQKISKSQLSEPFIIPDSREGWVDYLTQLLQSYVDKKVKFPVADYSLVRAKGAPIRGFGGTASGPEALIIMTDRITGLLDQYEGKYIDARAIVDSFNTVGECVVAGGVRRTAEIAFGEADDDQFLALKDFDNNKDAKEWPRWASNNSCFADTSTDFRRSAALTAQYGEPGYMFLENARKYGRMIDPPDYLDKNVMGGNPCLEQSLWDQELCCLVETFPSQCEDYKDYERTLKFAYLYAKTVTLVPTHHNRTNAVMKRNRRIGCSQSGIQDNIARLGVREHLNWCDQGYHYIRKLDEIYSNWLCIRPSIKHTSVKPSGSISKLVGVREGIHHAKGEYEIQAIRINQNSPLIPPLRKAGYRIEEAINEHDTVVVYFPMHYPGQRAIPPTMWEQLEIAAAMQAYWANNQVSVTIDFDQETEGPLIKRALELYAHRLKGVSFLPRDTRVYEQPPKRVCTKEEYEEYKSKLKKLKLKGLQTHEEEDKFCEGTTCTVPMAAAAT